MRKIFSLVSIIFLFQMSLQALDASISYSTFKGGNTNYVEINLFVLGSKVNYITLDSLSMQAKVEVIILFKQNEKIVKYDKFDLNSPISERPKDFVDLKRYGLPDGKYELEVSILDKNDIENETQFSGSFNLNFSDKKLLQSDIQLLSTFKKSEEENVFVKNGYYLEALPYNFYTKSSEKLIFYNEIYGSEEYSGDAIIISYGIDLVKNEKRRTEIIAHKKQKSQSVNVLLYQLDIKDLESGNYEFFVEIRNPAKEKISRKVVKFQRSNPYLQVTEKKMLSVNLQQEFVGKMNRKELQYSLRAIAPLVKDADVELLNTLLSKNKIDTIAQQRYLFNFWVNLDPNQPEILYNQYMEVARAVDKMYAGGFGYGFESDRGFIYMRFGRPDDIVTVENEPSAPPYEIWVYNDFPRTKQTNVKFLFYSPGLATDFQLLHSNARGEINNPQWELELYKSAPNEIQGNNYIDATQMQDNINRRARAYFNDY